MFFIDVFNTGELSGQRADRKFLGDAEREYADEVFASQDCARAAIFGYVMGFYNRNRRHSALGYDALITHAA